MNPLSHSHRAARLLSLLREVDLAAIKNEADRPFRLVLTGDAELATTLAELLSATPGRSGVHPYVVRSPQPVTAPADLQLNLQRGLEFTAPRNQNPKNQTPPDQTPTLSVCLMKAPKDAAGTAPQVGAELPHSGPHSNEVGRVIVGELTPETVQQVLVPEILRVLSPTLRLAVGKQLPVFRPAVIRGLVETSARANAIYAASTGVAEIVPVLNIPLNVADTVVLSKNQLVMAYKVALAAGRTGRPQEVLLELIGVLGGGLLFRQVARGLVGLIPVWGIVPKVAVAYAGTQVIGTAASLWATEGRTVSAAELRDLYAGALTHGRKVAASLLPQRFKRGKQGQAVVIEDEVLGELGSPDPAHTDNP